MTTILDKSRKLIDGKKIVVTKDYPIYGVIQGDIYQADEVVQNGEYMYKFFNKSDEKCFIPVSDAIIYQNKDDEILGRISDLTTEIRRMTGELVELQNLIKARN